MVRTAADGDGRLRTEHWWPDSEAGPWKVTLFWSRINGRPECVGLRLVGTGSGDAIDVVTATTLRQIPLGDLIAADRARLAPAVEATGGLRESAAERLRLAAVIYGRALREGKPPTKAVAEHFGISPGGASNLVARARAAGLLPPASPGKAYG